MISLQSSKTPAEQLKRVENTMIKNKVLLECKVVKRP